MVTETDESAKSIVMARPMIAWEATKVVEMENMHKRATFTHQDQLEMLS